MKNKLGRTALPNTKASYSSSNRDSMELVEGQTHRSVERNAEPGERPTPYIINGGGTASQWRKDGLSNKWCGTGGHPQAKKNEPQPQSQNLWVRGWQGDRWVWERAT